MSERPFAPDPDQTQHDDQPYAGQVSYTPPYEQSTYWAPRTPEHWLEPLPGHEQRTPRHTSRIGVLAGALLVALLGGSVGAGLTLLALDLREAPAATPVANQPASPTPAVAATAATPAAPPVDAGVIAKVADSVSPAVVTITALAGDAEDPFELPATGVGSGVIYDAAGWILTNRHVVVDVQNVRVELNDGTRLAGTVYGIDTLTDLAIVKVDGTSLPVAPLGDSSQLRPGQLAVVIGSPLGTFTNSVTSGVISALGRNNVPVTDPSTGETRRLNNLIQTDAAINPGNSGGPLVNEAGEVVGISTAVASGAQGIGFAIPINIAKPIMDQAAAGEPIERPWIGIRYIAIDRNVAEQQDLPIDYGALVSSASSQPAVFPGSPAADAGIQPGDIITAINGRRIDANNSLDDVLAAYRPGDVLSVMVLRDGATLQLSVTLAVRPAN
jgi:S1-C subfamily serine protease